MNNNDITRFGMMMTGAADYYEKKLSDFALGLYWKGLKEFDYSAIEQAMSRHVLNTDNGQFMPKVADIRKMLQGSSLDSAMSAWAKVDKSIRHIGTYATVVFDDPLIHVVLHEMGGWIGLGTKTDDDWPFVAKEFENRYRGFKARGEVPAYPPKLVGICESHNTQKDFEIDAPTLIGNAEKAKLVMQGGTDKPLLGFSKLQIDQPLKLEKSL